MTAAGVIFIAENGEGPGVRMRKRRPMVNPADGTLEGYTVAPEKPDDGNPPGHTTDPDEADHGRRRS